MDKLDKTITFKDKCNKAGVKYSKALYFRSKHSELSDNEIIDILLTGKHKIKTFTDKCIEYNINVNTARGYKYAHPELSDDEIINHYLSEKRETLVEKCKRIGISIGIKAYQTQRQLNYI